MMRFDVACEASAWAIIASLPMVQASLKIQRELVDQGKSLANTAAGQIFYGRSFNGTKGEEVSSVVLEKSHLHSGMGTTAKGQSTYKGFVTGASDDGIPLPSSATGATSNAGST